MMMRVKTVIASIFMVIFMSQSYPVLAADEPFSIKGLNERDAKLLIAGMAYGIAAVNVLLPRPYYCKQDGNVITGKDLWSLAEENLAGPFEVVIVAAAVAVELPKKYACKN